MPLTISVAHDYICPWCWIAVSQMRRLRAEFDVEFEWRGYELYPEGMEWPPRKVHEATDRPPTPTRTQLAFAVEGLEPAKGPPGMRTFRAHQAAEYAREKGVGQEFNERLYEAYWNQGLRINDLPVLRFLANGLISDLDDFEAAIEEQRYRDRVIVYDEPAYASGVYYVPTLFIDGKAYAEQPYSVLRKAVIEALGEPEVRPVYDGLDFQGAKDRPLVFINMVTTLDGKIITGDRDEPVMDLGSKTDHATLRHLESCADAVMIGAGTMRATPKIRFDERLWRIVVSESGELDPSHAFFKAPRVILVGKGQVDRVDKVELSDWSSTLVELRERFGIQRIVCEGGSELNASLLKAGCVDEVFITQTSKLKLGKDSPTIAGGQPFSREEVESWTLVSSRQVGDEVFLRYRR
ncbi:MAG: dihydrofolate reductase family protein [Chthonomonas sp.]|nr:dihydrofolate reductase family protein [Chthonomonas sp.]